MKYIWKTEQEWSTINLPVQEFCVRKLHVKYNLISRQYKRSFCPLTLNTLPHRDAFANRADPDQGLLCLLMEI